MKENNFKKTKLLLGNNKDFVELQKWPDGAWRLIDEAQGNKVLTEQDVFKLIFQRVYRLNGGRTMRIVFDRGRAERLVKQGRCVVDNQLNEYMYDPYVKQFVSSGLRYDSLPEFRQYTENILRKRTLNEFVPLDSLIKEQLKEEVKKELKEELKGDDETKQTSQEKRNQSQLPEERFEAVGEHNIWKYIVIATSSVAALGAVAWGAWKSFNIDK